MKCVAYTQLHQPEWQSYRVYRPLAQHAKQMLRLDLASKQEMRKRYLTIRIPWNCNSSLIGKLAACSSAWDYTKKLKLKKLIIKTIRDKHIECSRSRKHAEHITFST